MGPERRFSLLKPASVVRKTGSTLKSLKQQIVIQNQDRSMCLEVLTSIICNHNTWYHFC